MGYSLQAKNKYNEESAFFFYPDRDKDRPLHKVLNIKVKDQKRIEKPYSLGQLLEAKSKLMDITGTLGEQDFIDLAISAMKETNVKSILIIFN